MIPNTRNIQEDFIILEHEKTNRFLSSSENKRMERALDILRTMIGRRGLDTKTERIVTDDLERANLYTIGKILVVFSQKDKGLLDRDINGFMNFANANDYRMELSL
jgi:uncharacterized protein YajQ (UPF0234 family)